MLHIINTGNLDTDLVLFRQLKKDLNGKFLFIDLIEDSTLRQASDALSNTSLFGDTYIVVFNKLEINSQAKRLIKDYYKQSDIILLSCRKFSKKGLDKKFIIEKTLKFDYRQIKKDIQTVLNSLRINDTNLEQKLLELCQMKIDDKIFYSKIRLTNLIKKIKLLTKIYPNKPIAQLIYKYIIDVNSLNFTNPWDITKMFLMPPSDKKFKYFNILQEEIDIFYLLNRINNTLFLILAILDLKKQHYPAGTIAKKLKKNPYYVKKLIELIDHLNLTQEDIKKQLVHTFNLELNLKTGKLDQDMAWSKIKMER